MFDNLTTGAISHEGAVKAEDGVLVGVGHTAYMEVIFGMAE